MSLRKSDVIAQGLWTLADEFERNGNIPQVAKCLEAICCQDNVFQPVVEVKTRLRLAKLLLDHCENPKVAQSILERANTVAQSLHGAVGLSCSVIALLNRCYVQQQAPQLQKKILLKGMHIAKTSLSRTPNSPGLEWLSTFALKLAAAHLDASEGAAALDHLRMGRECARQAGNKAHELLFLLASFEVHLHLASPSPSLHPLLQEVDRMWTCLPQEGLPGLALYSHLLHATWRLRDADYKRATEHSSSCDALLATLPHPRGEGRGEGVGGREPDGQSPELREGSNGGLILGICASEGEWVSLPFVRSVADLVAVECQRPSGRFLKALRRAEEGVARLDESDLRSSRLEESGAALHVAMHLMESQTLILLTSTRYAQAQKVVVKMISYLDRFPGLLAPCLPPLHCLLGHYCHCMGRFQEAVVHFQTAKRYSPADSAFCASADVFSAVSCLALPGGASDALDLLSPVYATMDAHPPASLRVKAGVLFGMGLLKFKQGKVAEARPRLAASLKVSHSVLNSHHTVAQLMLMLGGVARQSGDPAQAREVVHKAMVLAKAAHDTPSILNGLQEMKTFLVETREDEAAMETEQAFKEKRCELEEARAEAAQSVDHQRLLEYGLTTQPRGAT